MNSDVAVVAAVFTLIGALVGAVSATTLTWTNARAERLAEAEGGKFGPAEQKAAQSRKKAKDYLQGVSWGFVVVGAATALIAL